MSSCEYRHSLLNTNAFSETLKPEYAYHVHRTEDIKFVLRLICICVSPGVLT